MSTETIDPTTGEITPVTPIISNDSLRAIQSVDDAAALIQELLNGEPILNAADELGNGFELVEDKSSLVKTWILLINWRFSAGDYDDEFVNVQAITRDGRKVVFNDGSVGIRKQLRELTDRTGRTAGMVVPRGLRASTYDYTDSRTGKTSQATTYYLDTSNKEG